MDEFNDFVIDTGMPVSPPVHGKNELTKTTENDTPINEAGASDIESSLSNEEPNEVSEDIEKPVLMEESEEYKTETESPNLTEVLSLIKDLERKFDEKIAVDEHKNGLFDKLYKERDEYKNDVYAKLLKPFVIGAINIIADLRMYISKMDTYDVDRSLIYLKTVPDDIVELLEDNGVELFEEDGELFNPKIQRAKKIVPTEEEALNNKVAERLEKGYRWNGVVLCPEMVAVYKIQNN